MPSLPPQADDAPAALLAQVGVLDTTAEGVALFDADGRLAFVNERLAKRLGRKRQDLIGRDALDVVGAAGRELVRNALGRRETTSVSELDVPLVRADGSLLWVLLAISPSVDAAGRYVGAVGIVTDVTERRRAKAATRASRLALAVENARLQRALEEQRSRVRVVSDISRLIGTQLDFDEIAHVVARAIAGGVVVNLLQPDGVMRMSACASVHEHIERRLRPLMGWSGTAPRGSIAEEAFRTREPVLLTGPEAIGRLQPPFGDVAKELGLGSVIVAPLMVHGRAIGLFAAFRGPGGQAFGADDVSLIEDVADRAAMAFERAQLAEQQRHATERLRLLADAGTLLSESLQVEPTLAALARLAVRWFAQESAVELFDEEGRIAAEALAASDEPLEAALRRAMAPYRSRSTSNAPSLLRGAFDSAQPQLVREVDEAVLRALAIDDAQLADLRAMNMRSLIIAPLLARGTTLGAVAFARTRGPLYDEEDLALSEDLARRAALAADNARLFRQAQEAVAVRDEFLSIAGHELNTPLTPLKMQLDSLRRGKFSPERTAEKLDAASRQVTRMAKLVSELLDVSRISGGRMHIEPERFDLAALVDEVVARVSEEAERAGSKIAARIERPCFGSWDRLRVDQVVSNVLTNAVKYGGGRPIDVELKAPGDGARVRLVVRDRGIGILPEHQRRIFERFERAASVRHYGGFGLGLWIARQIVEASGGTISVQSAPGEGSTFTIELPREPPRR